MKNLVVCCDGTWNTPDSQDDGILAPTNVVRLKNCLVVGSSAASEADEQLVYYHPGVGTDGSTLNKFLGGGFGVGIGRNIQSAYRWLADNYETGDRIFLFGFSRGAYTVRCISGMISHCGLLYTEKFQEDEAWQAVAAAYEAYLNRKSEADAQWWDSEWMFHSLGDSAEIDGSDHAIPIHFLGVWDTVGALGIPDNLLVVNYFDRFDRYTFSDTRLASNVINARHAVAMDEKRSNFAATLWDGKWDDQQDVHEIWFPGNHGDVGGGWAETDLSDGALKWMIEEAQACGLVVNPHMAAQVKPHPQGILHDSAGGWSKHLKPVPRAIPLLHDKDRFHESALIRHQTPPITQAPFWPTHALSEVGESFITKVYARDIWNYTGLWLDKDHQYQFVATGTWLDKNISCGPGGTRDGHFHWGELAHLAGSVLGQAEEFLQRLTDNEETDVAGSRRHEDFPWFCLVGSIANDVNPHVSGTPLRHEHFEIGEARDDIHPARSGYLYAYANDAWNFYANNRGSVTLEITRTD